MIPRPCTAHPAATPRTSGREPPQPVPPAAVAWLARAGDPDPAAVAAEWAAFPGTPQRLKVGPTFSVVDTAPRLGLQLVAKARLYQLRLGPIGVEGERLLFLASRDLEEAVALLPARDDAGTELDVRLRGPGQPRQVMVAGPVDPAAAEDDDCWWLIAPAADPPYLPPAEMVVRGLAATANALLRSNSCRWSE